MDTAPFPHWPKWFAKLAGGLVFLAGTAGLIGWASDIGTLKSVRPEWPGMAAGTALALALAGFSLWCASAAQSGAAGRLQGQTPKVLFRWLSLTSAGAVLVVSLAKGLEYLTGQDFGIDRLLFDALEQGAQPAAMAPASGVGLALLAFALLLANGSHSAAIFQCLVLLGGLIGWMGLSPFLYGGQPLLPYAQMGVHTALSLLLLSVGVLCTRRDGGLIELLTSDGVGGVIARRLVPAALLTPVVLSWLRTQGERIGLYGAEAGTALSALLNVLAIGGFIWATAALLQRSDSQRKAAEEALRAGQETLRALADNSAAVIYVKDLDGRYLLINQRYEELFRVRRDEIIGKTDYDLFSREAADDFRRVDRSVAESGTAIEAEEHVPLPEGSRTYLSIKYPLRNPAGEIYAVGGISSDITERKRDERALQESEERTRAIIEGALDGVIVMNHEGRIVEFNPAAERIFGHRSEDVIGRPLASTIIPTALRGAHRRGLAQYLASGEGPVLGKRIEVPGLRADGTEFPVELSIAKMPGDGPPMFTGFLRDITERQRAEETLRESEERFRTMADSAPVLIWVSGTDKRYTWFNRQWLEFTGRTMEAELGNGWADNIHPDDLERCLEIYTTAFDARKSFSMEYRLRRHDGAWRWLMDNGTPRYGSNQEFAGFIGSCTDVTERKDALEALRDSQERFQTLTESLPHLVWTCNPDGWCDYLSRQWVEYTGRPAQEQVGYGWADHVHPDDRDRVQAEWAAATVRGDQFNTEFRIRRGDGEYRWFKTRAVPQRDAEGRIVKWFGSNTDFEESKRAEQRLQKQLERLNLLDQITRAIGERQDLKSIFQVVIRRLEDSLPIDFGCVCLYDPVVEALTVTSVGVRSARLAHDLAMTEQAFIPIDRNGLSRCVRGQLVYEPNIREVDFAFPQRLARGGMGAFVAAPLLVESKVFGILVAARSKPNSFTSGDCEFLRQLTEHVALAAHQAQIYDALQRAYDDLRQTQQAVMQQERLRALGQMASGIAHDINNAVSPVALYTESLLENEPNLSPRTREYLETTQRAVEDVAHTVARMREFYREREPQLLLVPVDLNVLVRQVIDLTRARWSDMPQHRGIVIQLRAELAPDLPAAAGNESEIREALTNLVFNAVDAMPDGGILRVRTSAAAIGLKAQSSQYVRIEVIDTGLGMDEETRRRCLEPFFTTKGERGTGLGLAMVYGVAQRHNAEMEIESAVGEGTTVRLIFPLATDPIDLNQPVPANSAPRRQRILIVDDDPMMLKSLRDTLETEGHAVVTARGGEEGIEIFTAANGDAQRFAVVITDLGMPYVDGRKVASAVKAASPATPVILLTGWGQRLVAEGDVPPHVDRVLSKPPKLRELRTALVELAADFAPTKLM